jgi:hypothetical protein
MSLKQIGYALGILIVLAAIFGILASFTKPVVAPHEQATSPVLHGTATTTGDFEYKENGEGYKISVIYPSKTGLAAEADLRARTVLEQGLADIVQNFKSNAATSLTPDELARVKSMGTYYALGITYKPYSGSGTVSYEFDVYEDTGGAHPNGYFRTFVFSQDGNELKLADLLLDGFFKCFAGWNLGTRMEGTCTVAPVRGLRAWRAARILVLKMPRPAIETSPPFLSSPTMPSIMVSTARSASALVVPRTPCTFSAISCLFISKIWLSKASNWGCPAPLVYPPQKTAQQSHCE